jgi:hypothetical protein
VRAQDDLDAELTSSLDGGIEVVDLEPQQHAIAVRPEVGIADGAVVVLDVPVVELEDERAVRDETFVLGSTVSALAIEEHLVPAAARFDIAHRDEWLWSHDPMLRRSSGAARPRARRAARSAA